MIYLDWMDEDNDTGELMDIEWPDSLRIPVAGETLLVGIGSWNVVGVRWEIDQADYPDTVTLKLRSTSRDQETTGDPQ